MHGELLKHSKNLCARHFFPGRPRALLHAVLVAIHAFITAVTLIFRRRAGDVNVVGVVPVALDRVEDVLEAP